TLPCSARTNAPAPGVPIAISGPDPVIPLRSPDSARSFVQLAAGVGGISAPINPRLKLKKVVDVHHHILYIYTCPRRSLWPPRKEGAVSRPGIDASASRSLPD